MCRRLVICESCGVDPRRYSPEFEDPFKGTPLSDAAMDRVHGGGAAAVRFFSGSPFRQRRWR
jgi:hypothetical protein